MIFAEHASLEEKLRILSDAAKYDVACTSSGVSRQGKEGYIGNSSAAGICHSFSADGRCISLLKILFTNECIYNCKYCINRVTNDVPRATFTPEEVCQLTMEFYRRNYIEGLFLSSGIIQSADHTMELICQTLHDLRTVHRFHGYIHCKAIPGASPELVEMAGWYADRMSVNMELPTADGLRQLAPNKDRRQILTPMRQIQSGMEESREALGMKGGNRSAYWHTSRRLGRSMPDGISQRSEAPRLKALNREESHVGKVAVVPGGKAANAECAFSKRADRSGGVYKNAESDRSGAVMQDHLLQKCSGAALQQQSSGIPAQQSAVPKREASSLVLPDTAAGLTQWRRHDTGRGFVPAGQSTQMIIGAAGESDYEIMTVSEALYQRFDLKRVFYSAFINVNQDADLPTLESGPPLRREHRLYQADFLLRYYGFEADELLSPSRPNFNVFLDPKCDWALGHMESFPVEINTADYDTLLRVPGIGVKSASRIIKARRTGSLDYRHLKKMGVVLKRAIYFITCNGRMMYDFLKVEEDFITRRLVGEEKALQQSYEQDQIHYQQLSLFDFMT
ncbi:MAG TPA: putative DNA modification/repair radical SAM protein [Lachnospiraceae bacterium]|jgi:putative DNA modification/repair radical SAM protein|nr:putative DNA modification/repair radical SAM protein [Lachnospiraceae bacterium]